MALFSSATWYVTFLVTFTFYISRLWMRGNEQSRSFQFVKGFWCYPVLTEQCLKDSKESWIMQLLRDSVHHQQIVLTRKAEESRVLLVVSAKGWRAAPITPRWRRCPFDVWARLRDVVSLCECAKPAPEKEKRKNQKICWQRKYNALKKRRKAVVWNTLPLMVSCNNNNKKKRIQQQTIKQI